MKSALIFLLLPLFSITGFSDVIRVPDDYNTIQLAINAAHYMDTVLVSPGTYVENINFKAKAIKVKSSDGPRTTVIDGKNLFASVVLFNKSEGYGSVLEGFTVVNGSGTPHPEYPSLCGGGICCFYSSPTLVNNIIYDNSADEGGGIYCYKGSPLIVKNEIKDNDTVFHGGGIYFSGSSPINISENIIRGNTTGSHGYGGGIAFMSGDSCSMVDNIIYDNSSLCGGGIYCNVYSFPAIENNLIHGNSAHCFHE
jgi:hypothetical protein